MVLTINNTVALSCDELIEINGGNWLKSVAIVAGSLSAIALHDAIDFASGMWDEI